jgi:hypothetical protein
MLFENRLNKRSSLGEPTTPQFLRPHADALGVF